VLRAVIFDFDGVISDCEILHLRAFNEVLAPHGVEISMKDYYKDYLGLTDFDCFKTLAEQGLREADEVRIDSLVERKNTVFEELARTDGRIIEGVRDFLQMLRQNDIPMAICSGALLAEIELILDEAKLRSFFDVIVSAEQVKRGKPHPDGFELALERVNTRGKVPISAEQCVVVEDSHWGLEAAKTAGMHTIAVTNSYDADQLGMAERIVAHLGELSFNDLQKLCTD